MGWVGTFALDMTDACEEIGDGHEWAVASWGRFTGVEG